MRTSWLIGAAAAVLLSAAAPGQASAQAIQTLSGTITNRTPLVYNASPSLSLPQLPATAIGGLVQSATRGRLQSGLVTVIVLPNAVVTGNGALNNFTATGPVFGRIMYARTFQFR